MRRLVLFFLLGCLIVGHTARAQDQAPAAGTSGGDVAIDAVQGRDTERMSGLLLSTFEASYDLATGKKDASLGDLAQKYNETRGPYFHHLGFSLTKLLGTGTNLKGLGLLIKGAMVLVLCSVFAMALFGLKSGKVSITDIGWSLAKTFIGIFFFLRPGFVYAFVVMLPYVFTGWLGTLTSSHPSPLGTYVPATWIAEGTNAAVARFTSAMGSINTLDDVEPVIGVAYHLNELAKDSGVVAEELLVKLPPIAADAGIQPARTDARGNVTTPARARFMAEHRILSADEKIEIQRTTAALVNAMCGPILAWQGSATEPVAEKIAKHLKTARQKIADNGSAAEHKTAAFEKLMAASEQEVWNLLEKEILIKSIPAWRSSNAYKDALARSRQLKDSLDKKTTDHWALKFVRAVSTGAMSSFFVFVPTIWMCLLELVFLQLFLLLPAWINPKWEGSFMASLKLLMNVSLFLPAYILSLMVVEFILEFVTPEPSVMGILTGTFHSRLIVVSVMAVLTPLLAGTLAVYATVQLKKGGTILGGILRTTMTSIGTAAAVAVPAIRIAALAGSASMSKSADNLDAQAAKSTNPHEKQQLQARATFRRRMSKAVTYGQDALGRVFGANEKYINADNSSQENADGARAAMKAAAFSGIKGVVTGQKFSSVREELVRHGDDHLKKLKQADTKDGSGSVEAVLAAQKQAAAAQSQLIKTLEVIADRIGDTTHDEQTGVNSRSTRDVLDASLPAEDAPGRRSEAASQTLNPSATAASTSIAAAQTPAGAPAMVPERARAVTKREVEATVPTEAG